MPPKKGTSTPNKPPENTTWTLDEGKEMRRDINDLQKKTVTKYELQEMMDSMEAKLDTNMDGLKGDIMEGLKKFIIERTPKSENVSHEIHDEDTRKVNQEWRNSNFGLKTNHVPKIDMRKFDGKDPITWILQMEQFFDERKEKGLFFNCDSKYSKGHKCGEKKLFYIDCEKEEEQEQEPSQDENVVGISSKELTPMISCNALAGISTPQTLKIKGYIKKKKVIVLINSGSTHNFIHYKLAKALNCFVYPVPKFRVMIADGGTINFSRKCNKINLTMGEYVMNSPIIAIPMGGADVVLGI
jgi:gas vesicle protein